MAQAFQTKQAAHSDCVLGGLRSQAQTFRSVRRALSFGGTLLIHSDNVGFTVSQSHRSGLCGSMHQA